MIILDFLIYNLTRYYEEHRKLLTWSTPLERASYVVGMVTLMWTFIVCEMIYIFNNKTLVLSFELPFVIVGFGSMLLYKYIYIKRGRYERIVASPTKPFNINNKTGGIISIIFIFFSFLVMFGIMFLFT